jgi:hypothetical protein
MSNKDVIDTVKSLFSPTRFNRESPGAFQARGVTPAHIEAMKEFLGHFKSDADAAKFCNLSIANLSKMKFGNMMLPIDIAMLIHDKTDGLFHILKMRPDLKRLRSYLLEPIAIDN